MKIIQPNLHFRTKLKPLNLDNVYFIMIHHIDAKTATIKQIHEWHLSNGWSGVGYNEYIRKDGTVYIGRGDNEGAHCTGHNSDAYGIALEGNFNVEMMITIPQYKSLVERLQYHKKRFPNFKSIGGHRDFYSTDCPGKYFNMTNVLNDVNKVIDTRTEIQKAVDNAFAKGKITNKQYWQNVLEGKEPVNLDYLRIVLNK